MKTMMALSALLVSGVASAAPAQKGALDGGKYRLSGVLNGKPERDTVVFEKGMLHSLECDRYGFGPAPYRAKKNGDAVEFESTITSKSEGSIRIVGKVASGQLSSQAVWKKQGQKDVEYAMNGKIDRASEAAAASRADIEKTFGFVPVFFTQVSDHALPGAWEEMKGLEMNPNTALSGKVKELIGLGVASQIPCVYCIEAHTQFGRANGATDEELSEAVAMAALTRHWSTIFNGLQVDVALFQKELDTLLAAAKKGQEMKEMPKFMAQLLPASAVPGAARELADLEMSDTTALAAKEKSLIGLAVASQIPCTYCVKADTAFAKLAGATDQEIAEAVGMAALTRHWSTIVNGQQADRAQFDKDIKRILSGLKSKRQS
jgi:AhpD family alkylhydroperoxidase